jgi:hypothetical protein
MTKWRLTDKELQQRMDAISGGSFSRSLESGNINLGVVHVGFNINACVIEKVPEYTPNDWNEFPSVTPPVGEWMRCEFVNRLDGEIERNVAKYIEDGRWIDQCGYGVRNVDRFRPWED